MSPPSSRNRATGANTLITAASLALTLSGWAVLTATEAESPAPVAAGAPVSTPVASTPVVPTLVPLPTLIPTPDWANLSLPSIEAASADIPTAAPVPSADSVAPPAPTRVAPPAPVAITRSSR